MFWIVAAVAGWLGLAWLMNRLSHDREVAEQQRIDAAARGGIVPPRPGRVPWAERVEGRETYIPLPPSHRTRYFNGGREG